MVTTVLGFCIGNGMWFVEVYIDGRYDSEHWFHTQVAAEAFAEQRVLWKEAA